MVVNVSDIALAGNALNAQPTLCNDGYVVGCPLSAYRASSAVFRIDTTFLYLFKLKNRTNTKMTNDMVIINVLVFI